MDVKMMAAANSAVSAGQSAGANPAGTASDKTGLGMFAAVLQSAAGSDGSNAGDGGSGISAELLAAMGQMPQSLQLLLNQLQTDAGGEQTLLVKLLTAMSNDPKLADTLLKDKDMQAWLQDASALLSALAPNLQQLVPGAANAQSLSEIMGSGSQEGGALKLQQTLLTLATLLEKQPSTPLLGHLTAELQKVLAPHMDTINAESQSAATAQTAAVTEVAATGSNKLKISSHLQAQQADAQAQIANGKPASAPAEQKVPAISVQTAAVSKLEMLAAKGSFVAAALTGGSQSEALTNESASSQAADNTQDWLPGMPLNLAFKAEQPVELLKAPVTTLSAANFPEEMSQFFVKSMKISLLSNGVSEATLSLQPQNLGNVDVKLTMQNGHLIAHIATQTAAAKEMLESQLPQLRLMLQNQGLQVEKLEVTQNSHASSTMFHDQGTRGQSFGREQSGSRSGSDSGKFGLDEAVSAMEVIDAQEQLRMNGYGASFVATA